MPRGAVAPLESGHAIWEDRLAMADQRREDDEPPHDVLAAEQFPLGSADPLLHHRGSIVLPPDPTGIKAPHDVLAAEEFPLPAPPLRQAAFWRPSASVPPSPAGAEEGRRGEQRHGRARRGLAIATAAVGALALARRHGLRRRGAGPQQRTQRS